MTISASLEGATVVLSCVRQGCLMMQGVGKTKIAPQEGVPALSLGVVRISWPMTSGVGKMKIVSQIIVPHSGQGDIVNQKQAKVESCPGILSWNDFSMQGSSFLRKCCC